MRYVYILIFFIGIHFTLFGQPANDDCANATVINCGDNLTGQTTNGATDNGDVTGCLLGQGVWYQFTPTTDQSVTVTATPEAGFDIELAVASSSDCNTFTNIACQDGGGSGTAETVTFSATAGVTYYFYVAHWLDGGTTTGNFDISVSCTLPPANDDCANATVINCGDNLTGQTTNGATDNGDVTGCSVGRGVWYQFTPTIKQSVTVTATPETGFDIELAVASSSDCNTFTNIACQDGGGSGTAETVTFTADLGVTYYFYVAHWDGTGTTTGNFDIAITSCVNLIPDDCNQADTISCGAVSYPSVGATPSGVPAACGGVPDDDLWFIFQASQTSHTVYVTPSSTYDAVVEVYSGSCGGLTNINCTNSAGTGLPETVTLTGLTVGNYYYVRVFDAAAGIENTDEIRIRVDAPLPGAPANDDPCCAQTLTVNSGTCIYTTGENTGATEIAGIPAPGCGGYSGGDIWYKITVPASGQVVFDMNGAGGPTDMAMAIYTAGDCEDVASFSLIECDDNDSQNGTMPMICRVNSPNFCASSLNDCQHNAGLTPGQEIYVRVWENGNNTFGPFDICVYEPAPPPPTLISCTTAEDIPALPFSTSGTTCCYGDTVKSTACGGSSYLNGEDYIFTYTPPVNQQVDINLTGTDTYTGIFVFDGCPTTGTATCVANNTNSGGNPFLCGVSLTGGITYYIVISTFPAPDCTPFNISVRESVNLIDPNCEIGNYSVSSVPYNPTTPWCSSCTDAGITVDDRYAPAYSPVGFDFCFGGVNYSQVLIAANGYLIFDAYGCNSNLPDGNAAPGEYDAWSIDNNIPNTNDAPRNAILIPWQDLDIGNGGTICYKTIGTAPNRCLVVQYCDVAYFSCTSLTFTGEVRICEGTNNIEVHIQNKETCSSWNNGGGILGLHSLDGTQSVEVFDHADNGTDSPSPTITNQAWLFSPSPACTPANCITLPTRLADFKARYKEETKQVLLQWSTAEEDENVRFVLERSIDNLHTFRQVHSIPGKGQPSTYEYLDTPPEFSEEILYYRLIRIDAEGNSRIYGPVSVRLNAKSKVIIPSLIERNTPINIYFVGISGNVSVRVYNMQGTEMLKTNRFIAENSKISLKNSLPSGLYFIKIITKEGTYQKKFIVK